MESPGPSGPLDQRSRQSGKARNEKPNSYAGFDPNATGIVGVLGEMRDDDPIIEGDPNGEGKDSEDAEGSRRDLEVSDEASVQCAGLEHWECVLAYGYSNHDSGGPNGQQFYK